jgi:hypothetical protein
MLFAYQNSSIHNGAWKNKGCFFKSKNKFLIYFRI